MKSSAITTWQGPLTCHATYHTAGGKTCAPVHSAILRLDTDQRLSGRGEMCPNQHYPPAGAYSCAYGVAPTAPPQGTGLGTTVDAAALGPPLMHLS